MKQTDPILDLLKSLEWSALYEDEAICPSCEGMKPMQYNTIRTDVGHVAACALKLAMEARSIDPEPGEKLSRLIALACRQSENRQDAMAILVNAAAIMAVVDGVKIAHWMNALATKFDSITKAYKTNRADIRQVAGLGMIEAFPDVVEVKA